MGAGVLGVGWADVDVLVVGLAGVDVLVVGWADVVVLALGLEDVDLDVLRVDWVGVDWVVVDCEGLALAGPAERAVDGLAVAAVGRADRLGPRGVLETLDWLVAPGVFTPLVGPGVSPVSAAAEPRPLLQPAVPTRRPIAATAASARAERPRPVPGPALLPINVAPGGVKCWAANVPRRMRPSRPSSHSVRGGSARVTPPPCPVSGQQLAPWSPAGAWSGCLGP